MKKRSLRESVLSFTQQMRVIEAAREDSASFAFGRIFGQRGNLFFQFIDARLKRRGNRMTRELLFQLLQFALELSKIE